MNGDTTNINEGPPSHEQKNETPTRQIRLPSLSVITSTLRLRSKERGGSATALDNLISQTKETNFQTPLKQKDKEEKESPQYQVIQSPPHQILPPLQKDPYGTMRASKRIGGRIGNTNKSMALESSEVNGTNINLDLKS